MAYSGSWHPDKTEPERPPEPQEEKPSPAAKRSGRRPILDLGEFLGKTEVAGMETDDLLMALVLYLMYRESGDIDLLIMLGVMLLT